MAEYTISRNYSVWKRMKLNSEEEARKCEELIKAYGFSALNDYLDELGYPEEYITDTESPIYPCDKNWFSTAILEKEGEIIAENGKS